MTSVRPTAVAGMFYPADSDEIQKMFSRWMPMAATEQNIPKVLIAPHAGYVYSGEAAAKGYQLWQNAEESIDTVVVFGPAHRVSFENIATVGVDQLATPLGNLPVDKELCEELTDQFCQLWVSDYAHAPEHSIEVHLPFIKSVLPNVKVLPLLIGQVEAEKVAELIRYLWQKPGVYMVISSDLSHFHSYEQALQLDIRTSRLINHADWQPLNGEMACGYKGIQGLMSLQESLGFKIEQLALVNSGDTAGDKNSVVGYGCWAIYE